MSSLERIFVVCEMNDEATISKAYSTLNTAVDKDAYAIFKEMRR